MAKTTKVPGWLDAGLSDTNTRKLWAALQEAGYTDPVQTVRLCGPTLFADLRSVYIDALGLGDYAALVAAYQKASLGEYELQDSEEAEHTSEDPGHPGDGDGLREQGGSSNSG